MYFNKTIFCVLLFLVLVPGITGCHSIKQTQGPQSTEEYVSIFNEKDLSGWVNINDAPGTWLVENNELLCSGNIPSNLRTISQYENYVLEFDYLPGNPKGSAAIILHSGALPDCGQPFPSGTSFDLLQAVNNGDSTTQWNLFRAVCKHKKITVTINGREVLNKNLSQQENGYINFFSTGQALKIRGIRIRELTSATERSGAGIDENAGFKALYNSSDLAQWTMLPGHEGHWTAMDWKINYDGRSAEKDKCLWTKKSYHNFILIADIRLTRKPEMVKSPVVLPSGENEQNPDGTNKQVDILYAGDTGIYLRGDSKNQVNIGYRYLGSGEIYGYRVDKSLAPEIRAAVTPKLKADKPPGEWNRFIITLKDDKISVSLNGQLVINNASLPGIANSGPIALQDDHADNNTFQFANLYIKELQ